MQQTHSQNMQKSHHYPIEVQKVGRKNAQQEDVRVRKEEI